MKAGEMALQEHLFGLEPEKPKAKKPEPEKAAAPKPIVRAATHEPLTEEEKQRIIERPFNPHKRF